MGGLYGPRGTRDATGKTRDPGGSAMSIVDKVKQMLGQHPDKARQGVERAGDMIDDRTGDRHADNVDRVQEKASDYNDRGDGTRGAEHGEHREEHHGGDDSPGGAQRP